MSTITAAAIVPSFLILYFVCHLSYLVKKKMKTTLKLTTLLVGLALVFGTSCGKYEEGPGISFTSKKARVANTWEIEKYIVDGNEQDLTFFADVVFEFTKDGKYTFHSDDDKNVKEVQITDEKLAEELGLVVRVAPDLASSILAGRYNLVNKAKEISEIRKIGEEAVDPKEKFAIAQKLFEALKEKQLNLPQNAEPLNGCDFCMQFDYDEPHVIGVLAYER